MDIIIYLYYLTAQRRTNRRPPIAIRGQPHDYPVRPRHAQAKNNNSTTSEYLHHQNWLQSPGTLNIQHSVSDSGYQPSALSYPECHAIPYPAADVQQYPVSASPYPAMAQGTPFSMYPGMIGTQPS